MTYRTETEALRAKVSTLEDEVARLKGGLPQPPDGASKVKRQAILLWVVAIAASLPVVPCAVSGWLQREKSVEPGAGIDWLTPHDGRVVHFEGSVDVVHRAQRREESQVLPETFDEEVVDYLVPLATDARVLVYCGPECPEAVLERLAGAIDSGAGGPMRIDLTGHVYQGPHADLYYLSAEQLVAYAQRRDILLSDLVVIDLGEVSGEETRRMAPSYSTLRAINEEEPIRFRALLDIAASVPEFRNREPDFLVPVLGHPELLVYCEPGSCPLETIVSIRRAAEAPSRVELSLAGEVYDGDEREEVVSRARLRAYAAANAIDEATLVVVDVSAMDETLLPVPAIDVSRPGPIEMPLAVEGVRFTAILDVPARALAQDEPDEPPSRDPIFEDYLAPLAGNPRVLVYCAAIGCSSEARRALHAGVLESRSVPLGIRGRVYAGAGRASFVAGVDAYAAQHGLRVDDLAVVLMEVDDSGPPRWLGVAAALFFACVLWLMVVMYRRRARIEPELPRDRDMQSRDPMTVALLTFFTCHLFALYWQWVTTSQLRRLTGRRDLNPGIDLVMTIMTFGLWRLWVAWRNSEAIDDSLRARGEHSTAASTTIGLIAFMFVCGLAEYMMYFRLQENINRVAFESAYDSEAPIPPA